MANFAQHIGRVAKIIGAKAILVAEDGDWLSPVRVDTLEYRCQRWIDDIARSVRPSAA